jgi:hypothetical protein
MTDDPSMLGFQSYLLERFEYRFSSAFSIRDIADLKFRNVEDRFFADVELFLWGKKDLHGATETTVAYDSERVPRTWWDHFKFDNLHRFPRWVRRRVKSPQFREIQTSKTTTVVMDGPITRVYPHVTHPTPDRPGNRQHTLEVGLPYQPRTDAWNPNPRK